MRDVLASERVKAWSGKAWWVLALISVPIGVLASIGFTSEVETSGGLGAVEVTRQLVEIWFTMSLFAAIFGAQLVTKEYASGSIGRSALLSGGRTRLLLAKTIAALEVSAVLGLLTVALGVAAALLLLGTGDPVPFTWSGDATRTAIGVWVVTFVSGAWGVFLGWIARSTAVAVGALLVLTLLVDETLFGTVPSVGRFTFTKTHSSIYLDGYAELLPVWAAVVVMLAWLLGAGVVAARLYRARDIT